MAADRDAAGEQVVLDVVDKGVRASRGGNETGDRLQATVTIPGIRIDPSRTLNHHIFRIKDWPIALLVSEEIKNALEGMPDLGIIFSPAS